MLNIFNLALSGAWTGPVVCFSNSRTDTSELISLLNVISGVANLLGDKDPFHFDKSTEHEFQNPYLSPNKVSAAAPLFTYLNKFIVLLGP